MLSQRILLQSERLSFRKISYADFGELSAMFTNPNVMAAWGRTFSQKEIDNWIEKQFQDYAQDGVGWFAAVLKGNGEFIGQMGLHWSEIEGSRVLEVCYMLREEHWHNGYAGEGVSALILPAWLEMAISNVANNVFSLKGFTMYPAGSTCLAFSMVSLSA